MQISEMTDKHGNIHTDGTGIANAFADFHETLYTEPKDIQPEISTNMSGLDPVNLISVEEVEAALAHMKNGKAADQATMLAEVIKYAGQRMLTLIAELLSDVMAPNGHTPQYWREMVIKVLHKKGPAHVPDNYRPISIIPILYKLYATIVLTRIEADLDTAQSRGHVGFRKKRSATDHLLCMNFVVQMKREKGEPLWCAALDFRKAFDTTSHSSIWRSLEEQHIHPQYVQALQKQYNNQQARVCAGQLGREFPITRGTKQGDPISPALFNSVTQSIFDRLTKRIGKL